MDTRITKSVARDKLGVVTTALFMQKWVFMLDRRN